MTQQTNTTTASQVAAVNALLEAGEPGNISVDTYSGYIGYRPQAVVDAMNEAFGYGGWGFEELESTIEGADKATLAVSKVRVWLKGVDGFQPAAWGQGRVTKGDIGDAKKGAQTDALKKALSYFSIGARAYHGLLKEDGAPAPKASQSRQNGRQDGIMLGQSHDLADRLKAVTERAKTLGIDSNERWSAMLRYLEISKIKGEAEIALIEAYLTQEAEKREKTTF